MNPSFLPISCLSAVCLLCLSMAGALAEPVETMANQSWALRDTDGLFGRADLQEVVAAQSRRDAAAVATYFTHDDPLVRARAAFAAGSLQDPSMVPGLLKLLADPAARVRVDAAFALRQTPGVPSAELFRHFEAEKDREVARMTRAHF